MCCQDDPRSTLCEVCEKDVDHNVVVESGSSLFGRTYLALNAPKEARVQWEISLSRIGELKREIFKKRKFCLQCCQVTSEMCNCHLSLKDSREFRAIREKFVRMAKKQPNNRHYSDCGIAIRYEQMGAAPAGYRHPYVEGLQQETCPLRYVIPDIIIKLYR